MQRIKSGALLIACLALILGTFASASAGPLAGTAGPYRVEVTTDPSPVPVGPATLTVYLADTGGKAVAGADIHVLTQMPGMPMGEQPETAVPVAGKPGTYEVPANFQMAGGWGIRIQVEGPQGSGETTFRVQTGQSTAGAGGAFGLLPILGLLAALALGAFTLYRMRVTGQHLNLRALLRWQVVVGVLLLVAVYAGSVWAVHKFMKPGHMSVIEAQAMDMTVMKPPIGAVPVAAMAAKREPIDATVRYTGSAVSFGDQDVYPRVTGWITWMPFYPGDRVRRGQLLARLDSAELGSKVNEQAAAREMAEHAGAIARYQHRQALTAQAQAQAQVKEARSDLAGTRSELAAARQEVTAAAEERAGAQADLESAQTGIADAQAQLSAAEADQEYWTAQIKRSQGLLASGAISQEEYQRDRAQSENAAAKVRQARARIDQVSAAVRGAQSRVKRAEAMIAASREKAAQSEAKVQGSQSRIETAEANARGLAAAAEAASHEAEHTEAGVRQAEAQLATASVVKGYTEIRSLVDGVVTQRLISPGVLVNPGQAILKVSQVRPIRLQANVAESDLPNIRVGNRVRARTMRDPKHPTEARVTSVFPAVDPTARTAVVEAMVPNRDGRILPGEYLTMEITTGERKSALVVPSSAVVWQPKASDAVLATDQTPAVWVIMAGESQKTIYTCTMHPEVKQDKPGKCPT